MKDRAWSLALGQVGFSEPWVDASVLPSFLSLLSLGPPRGPVREHPTDPGFSKGFGDRSMVLVFGTTGDQPTSNWMPWDGYFRVMSHFPRYLKSGPGSL